MRNVIVISLRDAVRGIEIVKDNFENELQFEMLSTNEFLFFDMDNCIDCALILTASRVEIENFEDFIGLL